MAGERKNMPEQERSIKDREQELFFEPSEAASDRPLKPFPVYLQETPPVPISAAVKALLWVVGILVALLFLAALWRAQRPHTRPAPRSKSSTETSAIATPWQQSLNPCIVNCFHS